MRMVLVRNREKRTFVKKYKYKLEPNEIINDDDDVSINTISTKADEVIIEPVKKAGTIQFNFDCMNDVLALIYGYMSQGSFCPYT